MTDELTRLRDRVEELEELLGLRMEAPLHFPVHLSRTEERLLGILSSGRLVTKEFAHRALYAARPDCDVPEIQVVDVYACKLRRKLGPFGIAIKTKWGVGYYLDAENVARLKQLYEAPADGWQRVGDTAHAEAR